MFADDLMNINDDYGRPCRPSFLHAFHMFRCFDVDVSMSKVQLDSTLPSVGPVKTSEAFNWCWVCFKHEMRPDQISNDFKPTH